MISIKTTLLLKSHKKITINKNCPNIHYYYWASQAIQQQFKVWFDFHFSFPDCSDDWFVHYYYYSHLLRQFFSFFSYSSAFCCCGISIYLLLGTKNLSLLLLRYSAKCSFRQLNQFHRKFSIEIVRFFILLRFASKSNFVNADDFYLAFSQSCGKQGKVRIVETLLYV